MNKISVNILTLNGASAFIEKAIESVLPYSDDIIVYDTGSTDDTLRILKKYPVTVQFEDIQHLGKTWTNSKKDIALTQLLNELKDLSVGDYILKIDDDEVYPRELMEEIVNADLTEPIYSINFLHVGNNFKLHPIKRLFKNTKEINWNGIYGTETIALSGKRVSSQKCPTLKHFFYHLGGLRKDTERQHVYEYL